MSSPRLCPASSNILTLRDEDLGNLHENDTDSNSNSNQTKKLVERRIDIYLGCNFTSRDPGNYNCKLQVVTWKNGTTALCGSCSFCNLLEDSMQQSVESDLWNAWRLGDKLSPALWPRPLNIRAVTHFEKLEYRMELENAKDSTPWAIDAEAGNWSVYSSLLTGYVLLCPTSMNSGEEWKRVEVCVAFEIFGEEDDPVARLLKVHRRPLNGPFLSDQNVSKIRNWIKDCDEHHDGCCADLKQLASIEAGTFLPTRLVDIGGFVDDIHHPRLVITSEMQPKSSEDRVTKYIALSYCWGPVDGTTKLLKTTRKTIGSRTQKIELETMPQTFQDAVLVARTLGIQYLWIDSLCIIQDNSRDWQIESSKMPEVFSNAYLTLIAASASNCNDSFLSRRIPRLSCTVSLTLSQDSGAPISGQFSLRFRHRWNTTDKMAEISGSKWVTRGWTFQEERLARRVLMFGEKKFFFDCRTLERAEDTERYTSRPDWVTSVTPFEIPREVPEVNLATTTEVDSHWNHWQALCSHYAYRELTFPEDKLPAISGIASMLSQKVQSSYLAGLWRENLVHDLFWQTTAAAVRLGRRSIVLRRGRGPLLMDG
ncbi:hypothetical protein G7Y89_g9746 [Cudoniella acicularis]|uniref:Heterokaryon incompatibility domain-containing protein n=1 Tax=Cudoniella acicularis TaxID=354080 RepID=A0A8H4RF23_9HELO|nr:hypothetical protein G7Y89_g9746 [Cudoniella acicularis]